MSNIEHYFENLLFHGEDCKGEPNKCALSSQEQNAIKICADYIIYTTFGNRDEFLKYARGWEEE